VKKKEGEISRKKRTLGKKGKSDSPGRGSWEKGDEKAAGRGTRKGTCLSWQRDRRRPALGGEKGSKEKKSIFKEDENAGPSDHPTTIETHEQSGFIGDELGIPVVDWIIKKKTACKKVAAEEARPGRQQFRLPGLALRLPRRRQGEGEPSKKEKSGTHPQILRDEKETTEKPAMGKAQTAATPTPRVALPNQGGTRVVLLRKKRKDSLQRMGKERV